MSINAPVITGLSSVFGATWADRWDISGTFTFDAGGLPASDMEIWLRHVGVDADFSLCGTFNSAAAGFTVPHLCAASADPIQYQVRLRFNNYTDPPGPFSDTATVTMPDPSVFALVKETGAGLFNSNSYASVADADLYHAGHLYASTWTGATSAQKSVALVMATRLIDAEYQFNGTRTTANQALQWPRAMCPEPDNVHVPISALLPIPCDYVRYDSVPKAVVQATCEMARAMLVEDRTANPLGEGLKFTGLGVNQTSFDKSDRRPVLTQLAQVMLSKYGSQISAKSGAVRLVRV